MTAYFIIVVVDKKTNTDKVWICESVGKLKGVRQLAIAKMNELRFTRLLIFSFMFVIVARCLFEASDKFMIWLSKLTGEPSFFFQGPQESKKSVSFKILREKGGQTEVFNRNVETLLHHLPNSFHDK